MSSPRARLEECVHQIRKCACTLPPIVMTWENPEVMSCDIISADTMDLGEYN